MDGCVQAILFTAGLESDEVEIYTVVGITYDTNKVMYSIEKDQKCGVEYILSS